MRISQLSRSESVVRFRLEGRLTQQTSSELDGALAADLGAGRAVLLELGGVTFADAAGVERLHALRAAGCVLAGCSGYLAELLRGEAAPAARRTATAADTGLLARLRHGDEAAFAELVEHNTARLLAVAKRLLRNEDEARDAVQEAFLSAFKALPTFHGESKLSTWLHRITVNAALMRLRSRKHRAEQPIEDLLPRFDEDGAWADPAADGVAASHELLEQRETRVLVRRCIDQLPEAYRTILLLRDIEDLDTGEAAERLGITPNAVKIRLHRARQALKTLLERTMPDSPVSADAHVA
ncbi:MAG: sigma-70 family RNA polymerase sigma factor [Deltaproteobacteria bacterium]|nr:sigma-70 family RNA polymerase sigma factor [Deltaproteobacteria bacterium]